MILSQLRFIYMILMEMGGMNKIVKLNMIEIDPNDPDIDENGLNCELHVETPNLTLTNLS